jgi:hypothetical protein
VIEKSIFSYINYISYYHVCGNKTVHVILKVLKKLLIQKKNTFKGFHQNDSHDFLIELLDIIESELKTEVTLTFNSNNSIELDKFKVYFDNFENPKCKTLLEFNIIFSLRSMTKSRSLDPSEL